MIRIEIRPAHYGQGGYLRGLGHASKGHELVCTAATAIEDCLAANLASCWNVRVRRRAESGRYELNWAKTDKQGRGMRRANDAAGFAYNGLKALAAQYPEDITVAWIRPEA